MSRNETAKSESLYLSESSHHTLLNEEEERALINRAKNNDSEARDQLIAMNQRMVISMARRYLPQAGDLELMDLVQYGNLGLMEAIKRFDESRNLRFSTYAVWWIRSVMRRHGIKEGRRISISNTASEILVQISSAEAEIYKQTQRKPTQVEIAEHLHVAPTRIKEIWGAYEGVMDLDRTSGAENDYSDYLTLGELIPDESMSPEEICENLEVQKKVESALQSLDQDLREVLIYRFGLDGSDPLTLEGVSKIKNCSRETIRRYEELAKDAFHRALINERFKDYESNQ